MRVYSDHRGTAIILEDEADLDRLVRNLQEIKQFKAEQKRPWPGVYIVCDDRMPDEDARRFHDQVWFMNYTASMAPPPRDAAGTERGDS